jgi:hypothetical protein
VNKAAALVIPAVLLVSLSGCFGGGPGGGGAGGEDAEGEGSGGDGLEGGSTACVIDKNWQLDIADAAAKLAANLTSQGQNVVSSSGEGEQGIYFDQEGIAGSATNLTYTLTVDMGDGLVMTMTQAHAGESGGNWAWQGDAESTMGFDGWSGDYTVTTTSAINGTSTAPSVAELGGELNGQTMTVACDGDTMQTQASGSPFVQVWHATN